MFREHLEDNCGKSQRKGALRKMSKVLSWGVSVNMVCLGSFP